LIEYNNKLIMFLYWLVFVETTSFERGGEWGWRRRSFLLVDMDSGIVLLAPASLTSKLGNTLKKIDQ